MKTGLSLHQIKRMLNPSNVQKPENDLNILDSWVEYDNTGNTEKQPLDFMCFEFETMDPETGEKHHLFKAIRFARVIRLPKSAKQSTSFMDMQAQVLSGVHEQGYNMITVIANMIKPVPVGLVYLYGVQGVADNIEDAKSIAKRDFAGFINALMGTFKVLHMRVANALEGLWLEEKLRKMNYITAVRGIPKANTSGEDAGNKGMGGANLNPDSQGTLEDIITAMSDYEYVIEVLSSPVYQRTLMAWQNQTQKQMTDWNGQLQGTKSLSFNLSLPMMYGASNGSSRGWSKNYTDSRSVSYTQGESYSTGYSESVGRSLSESIGQSFGMSKGHSVTDSVGENHSFSRGLSHGTTQGYTEGISQGQTVGVTHGQSVGYSRGVARGESMGFTLGNSSGTNRGISQGTSQNSSFGSSRGSSIGQSLGTSASQSSGTSHSLGSSASESASQSSGTSHSFGQSASESASHSSGSSQSFGESASESSSHSSGSSQSFGQSASESTSHSSGSSQSFGQSASSSKSSNVGSSYGESIGQSSNTSRGESSSVNHSSGTSQNVSYGRNESLSLSNSKSNSVSSGQSWNHSEGTNNSTSGSVSTNFSGSGNFGGGSSKNEGGSKGTGYNSQVTPFGTGIGYSENSSESWGSSTSKSNGVGISGGAGISTSHSSGTSVSDSTGGSKGTSSSQGATIGSSNGFSESHGAGVSESYSVGKGNSYSEGFGVSYGQNKGMSYSNGVSEGVGTSQSHGTSQSMSNGHSSGTSQSHGTSQSMSNGSSFGTSQSHGTSQSMSNGSSFGTSQSDGTSQSMSNGSSFGTSQSSGSSQSASNGVSSSSSSGQNEGTSESRGSGQSFGQSSGESYSLSISQNRGVSLTNSMSQSASESVSNSMSNSLSQSWSNSMSESTSESQSESNGTSSTHAVGNSESESYTQSLSNGTGKSWGKSNSVSEGQSYGKSQGESQGISNGLTGAYTTGTSGSMGLGPSFGYSKSYQWLDQQVKDILEMLEYENERLKKALRGNGAFYTYCYIACPDLDALAVAQVAAKSAWQNSFALTQPLQVLDLSPEEQQHLLYRFMAFSADVTRENVAGISEYKFATVLLPEEYVAYTHLPRVSEGGIDTSIDDIPKFRVPAMLSGNIYMGTILNSERYTFANGYETPYDYRIDIDELMHGVITGASRSGKTVAAMRFIRELANSRRTATGKRLRIVIMDPKQDWRGIARFVEPERFRFYSMGNTHFRPINLNPCKIPVGVEPQHWIDGIVNIYCRAYGLLERGKQILADIFYKLYSDAGVFNSQDEKTFPSHEEWMKEVSRRSATVTFHKIYKEMEAKQTSSNGPNKRAGNDTLDAYSRLLERLSCFSREYSIEYRLFSQEDSFADKDSTGLGSGVDELIGEDDVTVFESFGLESTFANFIFGILTSGFYKVAKSYERGYLNPKQYETVLVIEEANKVLTGNDTAGTGGSGSVTLSGQSEFEEILDQSAGYGLFIFAITQKISMMPSSIIANCGLLFIGKISQPEDVDLAVRMIGREGRIEDRDVVKWLPNSPTGWFICRSNRGYDFRNAHPVLVKISPLNNAMISNAELDEILCRRDMRKIISVA